ncbi:NFACT family protein [Candidatus Bathyarchaeota archaeon]|nr:NFACT family protein [Candidatus Bathyarchaeota archaeon]
MGSFEIAAAVAELRNLILDAFIDNIYDLSDQAFLLRVRKAGKTFQIILEAGRRVHLTNYSFPRPPRPSGFCSLLRKGLRGGMIKSLEQRGFDRIVILEVLRKEGSYKLVAELFERGNIILVNPQNLIEGALFYRRMRDRDVHPKASFSYPPMAGMDPRKVDIKDLESLIPSEGVEVIKVLVRGLGLRSPYSDEILLQAGIDAKKSMKLLEREEIKGLYEALKSLTKRLDSPPYEASIIYDAEGRMLDVVPFPLKVYDGLPKKSFQSFNEALDEFFTNLFASGILLKEIDSAKKRLDSLRRILNEQRKRAQELKEGVEANKKIGDLIMQNLPILKELYDGLVEERRAGKSWDDILRHFEELKASGKEAFQIASEILPERHSASIRLQNTSFELDLLKSPQENAEVYYSRSKEARRKLEGLLKAMAETEAAIEKLETTTVAPQSPFVPKKIRKKAWYESFHHFLSSDGFMVLAGKDASSNEALLRRFMEPKDLVLHADFSGASFVLIKAQGKEIPERTIREAAIFAACHSKAWSLGLASATVFFVKPEQVSKSPPSGQFLRKGAFMIRGPKHFIRDIPLRLTIGIKIDEDGEEPSILAGPKDAIATRTEAYLEIVPGNKTPRELAEELRSRLIENLRKKGLKVTETNISIEDFQRSLPAGRGEIAS